MIQVSPCAIHTEIDRSREVRQPVSWFIIYTKIWLRQVMFQARWLTALEYRIDVQYDLKSQKL